MTMAKLDKKDKLVYSTRTGDERKKTETTNGPPRTLPPGQQKLKIIRDKKCRRGQKVTVIYVFLLN
jgi:hypothetical protein